MASDRRLRASFAERRWSLIGLAALLMTLLAPVAVASEPAVEHLMSFPDIDRQYVHVVSRFPVQGDTVVLRLPNWIPGSYKIRDFAGGLDRIVPGDESGAPLPFEKVNKNTWRVETRGADALVVAYDVHAGALSVRESWVSRDFVLINPATVVLYTEETRAQAQRVHVETPEGLNGVYSSLLPAPDGAGWLAADYDELVDSPLVVNDRPPSSFSEDGRTYHLLNAGDGTLWDVPESMENLQAVVAAANDLWGEVPLDRDYWFFNLLVERGGGLEHDHNTVLMTSRWNTRDREDFIGWLSLASHEYFHVWNVRRMRPAGLATYDYETEQYTPSLWIAEGLTSYYDNLLLSRAGVVSAKEYLKLLAKDFHRLEGTPGRNLISLKQASRDAWIRLYGDSANNINSNVSYYTKGAVVGFALDARIREESHGRRSLDDVMRAMWQQWSDTPYPESAFPQAVAEVAGIRVRDWLEPLLSTPADPDLDEALAYYGLALDRHPELAAAEESGLNPGAGLGVNWDKQASELIVGATLHDTAAARTGLIPGDELLAINQQRVRKDDLADRMKRLRPGETVDLLIMRQGRVFELTLELDPARPERYEIGLGPDAGQREFERLRSWLGQPVEVADED